MDPPLTPSVPSVLGEARCQPKLSLASATCAERSGNVVRGGSMSTLCAVRKVVV